MPSNGPNPAIRASAVVAFLLLVFAGCSTSPTTEPPTPAATETASSTEQVGEGSPDTRAATPRVQINADAIRVADDQIVVLDELGRVPEGDAAPPEGLLIPALGESLPEGSSSDQAPTAIPLIGEPEPDRTGSGEAPPRLVVSAAATIPFSTFTKVLYTVGSEGWPDPIFELSRIASGSDAIVTINPEGRGVSPRNAPLGLTLAVEPEGFRIASQGALLPAMSHCPSPGATICLKDPEVDVPALSKDASRAAATGEAERADELLAQVVDAYDFQNLARSLEAESSAHPEANMITFTAHPETPIAVLAELAAVAQERFPVIVFAVLM